MNDHSDEGASDFASVPNHEWGASDFASVPNHSTEYVSQVRPHFGARSLI
jgi:hypothetical protein